MKYILTHMLNWPEDEILIGDSRWHLVSEFISSVVNQFKSDLVEISMKTEEKI